MFPLDTCVPSRVDVPLCIFAGIPFLMVCLSPMCWACDGCVSVFDIEPARITDVVIREHFDKIQRGRCCWIVTPWAGWLWDEPCWSLLYSPACSASAALLVVGKWCTDISSTHASSSASLRIPHLPPAVFSWVLQSVARRGGI